MLCHLTSAKWWPSPKTIQTRGRGVEEDDEGVALDSEVTPRETKLTFSLSLPFPGDIAGPCPIQHYRTTLKHVTLDNNRGNATDTGDAQDESPERVR